MFSNVIDIEKNPKITDDVTQKHEINDTLKVGANLGLLYFLQNPKKHISNEYLSINHSSESNI